MKIIEKCQSNIKSKTSIKRQIKDEAGDVRVYVEEQRIQFKEVRGNFSFDIVKANSFKEEKKDEKSNHR